MIFALRQLIEKHWEFNKPLYIAFLDLEKAFDRIPRGNSQMVGYINHMVGDLSQIVGDLSQMIGYLS